MVCQKLGVGIVSLYKFNLFSSVLHSQQHRFSTKNRKTATAISASIPFILLLLDLWRVPIIILIATTGAPTCAVSIAAVSLSLNRSEKGSSSDTHDAEQQLPNKMTANLIEGGDPRSGGLLPLTFGGLNNNNYPEDSKESHSVSSKKAGIVKRGGGETRITSNQDVTTLALAVDNSSSVAIANINSSWNNVNVFIGTPSSNPFQYPPASNM